MFFSLKSKLITSLAIAVLLVGAIAFLTHHPVSMAKEEGHSECDTTCQIACFTQAVANVGAIPSNFNTSAYALPLVTIVFIAFLSVIVLKAYSDGVFHNLGPPLYKQFESYRI